MVVVRYVWAVGMQCIYCKDKVLVEVTCCLAGHEEGEEKQTCFF